MMSGRFATKAFTTSLALCATLLLGVGTAAAQDAGSHGGLLFGRGLLGVGYGLLEQDEGGRGLSARGFALDWDASLGINVVDNLAAHVSFFGVNAIGARIEQDGRKINTSKSGMAIAGLGPGLTYHVPRVNLYLSLAAGMGWTLVAPLDSPQGFGRLGFGTELVIGKDWWIRKGLAVGAAVQAVYVRISRDDLDYDGFGGGLAANFTYR